MQALTILRETADRICGKRLKAVISILVDAMERHRHLALDTGVRRSLLSDERRNYGPPLEATKEAGKHKRRRSHINTPLRKSIAIRTFGDWNDPPPGFFEMDMVAHCGKSIVGIAPTLTFLPTSGTNVSG